MKDKLLQEMENYFGSDAKRIDHARRVLNFAEQILKNENGDRKIVEAAAILHDIGIHAAEKKHGSTAGKYQEIEGPPIAENILRKINFPEDKIEEVLEIIANHHTPRKVKTNNFNILYDADWLVNFGDEHNISDKSRTLKLVEKIFLTKTGKKLAREIYINQDDEVVNLAGLVKYQKGSVVSKTAIDKKTGTVTLFGFDEGQGLKEHSAPFDALVYALDGKAEIIIAGEPHQIKKGEMIIMPANKPHGLKTKSRFKMLLIMIKS